MALLLCLALTAALARGCLHCHGNFSEKFSFYRHHVNLKSWWVGDIPVSGSLLTDWSQDTMKELHLAIPAEITWEKLNQVANVVYQRMDQLYQGKLYFPGYFPNELRAIFREQVHLIQKAIIESIFQYETISCTNCTNSHVVCFGYSCESSAEWKAAVQGLLQHINNWSKQNTNTSPVTCPAGTRGPGLQQNPTRESKVWEGKKDWGTHVSLQLRITKLQVSGVLAPGQPDSGKRLQVPDTALRAARPARPAPAMGRGLRWTASAWRCGAGLLLPGCSTRLGARAGPGWGWEDGKGGRWVCI
uniref:Izumo sperm-egg fusion protein 4 isoform X3 n=1 Tax=Tursiops truncatus TaxID=9739 RepID=A0A6J3R8F3_TURTR|nr:izumo sperm-egg fusion protein 4 isoform X3 [Tursiops truncatus]